MDEKKKKDVLQGTLALMALKTLEVLGPMHGYGIARRIEQVSGGQCWKEEQDQPPQHPCGDKPARPTGYKTPGGNE